MKKINGSILFIILSFFILRGSICYASGGHQSLEQTVTKARIIIKATVTEVKKGSDKWGELYIKANKIETLKGNLNDKSLLLKFQAILLSKESNGIKSWNMVPQSGKELQMKKNEIWFFFFYSDQKDTKGFIYIFRGEPIDQEKKIRYLIKRSKN